MFANKKFILFIFSFILTDCFTFLISFLTAFYFRFYILPTDNIYIYSLNLYLKIVFLLIPIWILFVNFFVGYKLFYISTFNLFIKILKTSTAFIIFILALIFIIKNDTSRLLLFIMWLNLIIFTIPARYILKKIIAFIIYKLNIRNNIIVIGKKVRRYKKVFNNSYINKVFYYPFELNNNNTERLKFLSLKKHIREIVIVNYSINNEQILSFFDWAQTNDIDIKIIPNETQMAKNKIVLDETLGIPVIFLISNPVYNFDYFLKRLLDIFISFVLLILLSPVFLVIALLIKFESKGPCFFKQLRVGYNEKDFYCYKFRSMYVDAETKLDNVKINNDNIFFKMKNDPRITKIGKFIRKYSIDELPQLLNVLKGEMSIIGPRPMFRLELKQIKSIYHNYSYKKIFKVLPGITGLWQVSGRSLLNDEKRLELEIYYVDNWSLSFDIKILLKTIIVVIFHKGAY